MDSDQLDIAKLQAVLQEAHTSDRSCAFHHLDEEINKVKSVRESCGSALVSLERLQRKYSDALNDIRKRRSILACKIHSLRSTNSGESSTRALRQVVNPRSPFFTDTELYQPPDNQDVVSIKRMGLVNMMRPPSTRQWNTVDKKLLTDAVYEQAKKIHSNLVQSKFRALQRDPSSSLSDLNKAVMDIDKIGDMSHEVIVGPLNDCNSYDWDIVSTTLQGRHTAFECQSMWRILLHPSINKSPWTAGETHKLRLVALFHNNTDWDAIATDLDTGRSAYQCFVYYKMKIRRNESSGLRWTPEEDTHLFNVIEHCRVGNHIPWSKVSFFLHNRSKRQIYCRWVHKRLFFKKGILSPEEIAVLQAAFAIYGKQFGRIAKLLPGRSKTNVIQYFYSVFGPLKNPIDQNWSADEDSILLEIADKHERIDFEEIHKMLPKKTLFGIKSRYNQLLLEYLGKKKNIDTIPLCLSESPTPEASSELRRALKNLHESQRPLDKHKRIKSNPNKKEIETDNLDRRIIRFFAEDKAPKIQKKPKSNIDSTTLRSLLYLLGANLDYDSLQCNEFLNSNYSLKKALEESLHINHVKKPVQPSGIRTYSRKKPVEEPPTSQNDIFASNISIWSHQSNKNTNLQNYFPPMLDTLSAIRTMSLLKYHHSSVINKCTRIEYFLKLSDMEKQHALFISRFDVIFRWPLLLSFIATNQHLLTSIDDQNKLFLPDDINCLSYSSTDTDTNLNKNNSVKFNWLENTEEKEKISTFKSPDDESTNKAHCSHNISKICYKNKRKLDTDNQKSRKKLNKT